jgi:hypothetical protein
MTNPSAVAEDTLYCANHPQTPTRLRCNKCGKPICTRCVVRTPVGYRCRECVRSQQQIFETALWYDYVVAGVISLIVGVLGAALIGRMSFLLFVIILGPVAGGVTAELVRAAVRRRRSRYLPWVSVGAYLLGALGLLFGPLLLGVALALMSGQGSELAGLVPALLFRLLGPLIFIALSASTLYARLRGISV